MKRIAERVRAGELLLSDGAWGTFLQKKGLKPGECPELWCVDHRADVLDVARSYVAAGCDMIETGARIVGGCCGTTPAHLAAIGTLLKRKVAGQA